MKNISRLLLPVAGFALAVFALNSAVEAAAPVKKPTVFVEAAKKQESSESFLLPAQISSAVNSKIISEGEGLVVKLEKAAGDRVRLGDELLVIKNTDPAYDYAPLKMKASINGAVAAWDVTEGATVTRGQILGTLIDPSRIKVSVEIPASDINKIRVGQSATLQVENLEAPLELKVSNLSPALDPVTGTLKAELRPVNLTAKARSMLASGLLAKVEIHGDARPAFLVTQDAIVYKEGKQYLRVVSQNKARFVPIVVGKTHGERVEVASGLNAGDEVILRASGFVGDGQEVEIFVPETTASEKTDPKKQSNSPQAR